MTTQTLFIIGIISGVLGMSLGILITYRHYLRIKQSIETGIAQAEEELYQDLKNTPSDELILTKAGKELIKELIIDDEKALSAMRQEQKARFRHNNFNTRLYDLITHKMSPEDIIDALTKEQDVHSSNVKPSYNPQEHKAG